MAKATVMQIVTADFNTEVYFNKNEFARNGINYKFMAYGIKRVIKKNQAGTTNSNYILYGFRWPLWLRTPPEFCRGAWGIDDTVNNTFIMGCARYFYSFGIKQHDAC